jgi:hypothetical protein
MSTPVPAPPVSRRGRRSDSCPYCGQALLGRQAVRHLRESELELERRLGAIVRETAPEFETELTLRLQAERREHAERRQARPDVRAKRPAAANADYAEDLDVLRTHFRQF